MSESQKLNHDVPSRVDEDVSPLLKETIAAYDLIAEEYTQRTSDLDKFDGVYQDLVYFTELLDGKLILDAGAGPCRDTAFFLKMGFNVEAIDLSLNMLLAGHKLCPDGVKRVMNVTRLGYRDCQFDGIWCNAVLLHLDDIAFCEAVKEFRRVLKPNGFLYISIKEGNGYEIIKEKIKEGCQRAFFYRKKDWLISLLARNNFELLCINQRTEQLEHYTNHWITVFAKAL